MAAPMLEGNRCLASQIVRPLICLTGSSFFSALFERSH
jgi:hypothetical protein